MEGQTRDSKNLENKDFFKEPFPIDSLAAVWGCFPLSAMFLGIAFFTIFGVYQILNYSNIAIGRKIEPLDLMLRVLDTHFADPFYLLEDTADLEEIRLRLPYNQSYRQGDPISFIDIAKIDNNFHAKINFKYSKPCVMRSTTLHTNLSRIELDRARHLVDSVYRSGTGHSSRRPETAIAGQDDRSLAIEWGRGLLDLWLREAKMPYSGLKAGSDPSRIYSMKSNYSGKGFDIHNLLLCYLDDSYDVTDECYWLAYHRLCGGNSVVEADLLKLEDLVREAYPTEPDYQAAVVWAFNLYDRLDRNQQLMYKDFEKVKPNWSFRSLPPRTKQTAYWIIYMYLGLTKESSNIARNRWLDCFPRGKAGEIYRWGHVLEAQRRLEGETLPTSSPNLALVCVVERLTGTDAYGERCRQILNENLKSPFFDTYALQASVESCYPGEDFFYLLSTDGRLALHSRNFFSDTTSNFIGSVSLSFLNLMIIWWSCRVVVFGLVAEALLFLHDNKNYIIYKNSGFVLDKNKVIICYILLPLIMWQHAWFTLPSQLSVMSSYWKLLPGVYLSLIAGGTVTLVLARLVAVIMLGMGININNSYWDEVLGALAGSYVLYQFGNSTPSIVASTAFALAPEFLNRCLGKYSRPTA